MMQLYYTQSSPYANCVCMLITELAIQNQIDMIISHPFDNQESFLQASPLGKVPCLINGQETVGDSQVICDYLDANYNNGDLFNPIYADWRLKTFYSICYGAIDLSVARRIESLREKEENHSIFWQQRQNQGIQGGLSLLGYLNFRHTDIEWDKQYPSLSQFYEQFKARASIAQNLFSD